MKNKKQKNKIVIGIGLGLAVLLLAYGIGKNKDQEPKAIAESAKVEASKKIQDSVGYNIRINSENPSQPYVTNGTEAADSNYFIPTAVPNLTSLVEPQKNATIVWVSAKTCHICHQMRPFVATSANKFADKIALKEIDINQNRHIANATQITGTPTFFILDKKGQLAHRFNGATREMFEQLLLQASQLN